MTAPAFKPSQVVLHIPPLTATMGKTEAEFAAALIVYVCTVKGDTWQAVAWADVQAVAREAIAATELTPRQKWLLGALGNPFLRPDVPALVGRGFAEMIPGERIVVALTPSALEAIGARWVLFEEKK